MPPPAESSPRPSPANDLPPASDVIRYGVKPVALQEMAERLLRELPLEDLQQPAAALCLPAVLARRMGLRGRVSALLRRVRYDQIELDRWSDRMRGQADLLFRNLAHDVQQFGHVRWQSFRVPPSPAKRPLRPAIARRLAALLEKVWARLAPAEWARSPGALHLRRASMATLLRLKINTLGQLHAALSAGGGRFPGPTAVIWLDLEEAIRALGPVIREDGAVDWLKYAAGRGCNIFPVEAGPIAPDEYPARVLETIAAILKLHFTPAHAGALDAFFLRLEADHVPLRERAKPLGATTSQVMAWERAVLSILQAVFQRGDYSGVRFHLREEITAPLRQFQAALGDLPHRRPESTRWDRLIAEHWGPDAVGKGFSQRLLPALLGVPRPGRGLASSQPPQRLSLLAAALLISAPGGLTLAELNERLQSAPAYKDAADLESSLRKSSRIFLFDDRFYLGSYKSVLADECARLLRRAGRPLRPGELAEALQPRMPGRTLTSLKAGCGEAMREDKARRFRAGKGKAIFGLADWPDPIVPLEEAIVEAFRELPRRVQTAAVAERIRPLNPVPEKELIDFLAASPQIRRLGFSLWEWIAKE